MTCNVVIRVILLVHVRSIDSVSLYVPRNPNPKKIKRKSSLATRNYTIDLQTEITSCRTHRLASYMLLAAIATSIIIIIKFMVKGATALLLLLLSILPVRHRRVS